MEEQEQQLALDGSKNVNNVGTNPSTRSFGLMVRG